MTDETKATATTDETAVPVVATTTEAPASTEAVAAKATSGEKRPRTHDKPYPKAIEKVSGPYAIIETGGKQYRVKEGDRLTIERLADDAGADITFDRVLLLGGTGATKIGTPVVEGASVSARIDDHGRGEKIVVFKFKAKKRYRRRTGHRQSQTYVTITGITG